MLSITAFIAGFRMVKGTGHFAEAKMHRINGFLTVSFYIFVAVLSIASGTRFLHTGVAGILRDHQKYDIRILRAEDFQSFTKSVFGSVRPIVTYHDLHYATTSNRFDNSDTRRICSSDITSLWNFY